ncbi:hypothetical protein [Brevundimonas diminuta]|uniref:hypothetical protein n=1 Tax=Brevundimonas diminuta TaxID=293 RepID=UPI0011787CF4|nr:hypothetical protein [Brevundimonas diminuta]
MAGAFALMCVVLASLPQAFPAVTTPGRIGLAFAAAGAIAGYLVSVVFGGRGWIYTARGGAVHPFNIQACAGLIGVVLHGVALWVIATHPADDAARQRLLTLERRTATLEARVDAVERGASTPALPVEVTCVHREKATPCIVK